MKQLETLAHNITNLYYLARRIEANELVNNRTLVGNINGVAAASIEVVESLIFCRTCSSPHSEEYPVLITEDGWIHASCDPNMKHKGCPLCFCPPDAPHNETIAGEIVQSVCCSNDISQCPMSKNWVTLEVWEALPRLEPVSVVTQTIQAAMDLFKEEGK